jgi:hypothetical protein
VAGKTIVLHFAFYAAETGGCLDRTNKMLIRIAHPEYGHAVSAGPRVRAKLSEDVA